MRKPIIAVLRGKPTSGKSTAFHTLKKNKKMKTWIFVDHCAIKDMLENLPDEERKKLGKQILFFTMNKIMPLKKNILVEEISREAILKNLKKEIRKYKYEIKVFQFEVSLSTAYKRNIMRAKQKWHPLMSKKWLKEAHEKHQKSVDVDAILVDTNKLSKKQVVEFIVRKLK